MTPLSHKKKKPLDYLLNPYEIAFAGFSGSGKTTLIQKLTQAFTDKYKIGYVKSDAHHFDIDKKGKDTERMYSAGASNVYIHNSKSSALQISHPHKNNLLAYDFIDCDFVFVEGYKNSPVKKFIFVNQYNFSQDLFENSSDSILGIIGDTAENPTSFALPYFHRDDLVAIQSAILSHFKTLTSQRPIYGLLLGGGKSVRMGTDKNYLTFKCKPLSQRGLDALSKVCNRVFHSCTAGQSPTAPYQPLYDTFLNLGPMGGILTAQQTHPKATWLVLATDLPLVDEKVLSHLVQFRNPFKMATAFDSDYSRHPEPLCTLWEPKSYLRNLQILARGLGCPRNALIESEVEVIPQLFKGSLDNANTPQDFENIVNS